MMYKDGYIIIFTIVHSIVTSNSRCLAFMAYDCSKSDLNHTTISHVDLPICTKPNIKPDSYY